MNVIIPIILFVGLSVGLTWFFLAHDHGEKVPIGTLWLTFGFGFLGAIAAAVLEQLILPDSVKTGVAQNASMSLLIGALGVGIIEEGCKFLPLALFLYRKRYFNEHIDGVIYFGLAGLGFGLPENILYSIDFGLHTSLTRLIMTPFFHVATTALVGYFLVQAKLDRKPLWLPGVALGGAALIHGLYDFGAFSAQTTLGVMSMMITLSMTAVLFVLYMRAGEIDRYQGRSVVGNNSFCRSCGFPNPEHHLYCTRCGRRA